MKDERREKWARGDFGPLPAPVMTPRETVSELDRYIVGQREAKRAVAIALRNRWRRQLVSEDLREEIAPKNIIMIGPTGVGKTEISRRLAKLSQAPFIKVEASKFTEVGYVGRDVESIIRDLMELAVNMAKEKERQSVEIRARVLAEERILDLLLPAMPQDKPAESGQEEANLQGTREKLKKMLRGDCVPNHSPLCRRQNRYTVFHPHPRPLPPYPARAQWESEHRYWPRTFE